MAKQYWLKHEGELYGPYSGGKLKILAASGHIQHDDQVSADRQSWQLAGTVRGLFPAETRPPQTASVARATSGSHRRQTSAPELEHWFLPSLSRGVRVTMVIAGVIVAGLIVTAPIWLEALSDEPETSRPLARSSENAEDEGSVTGNPAGPHRPSTPARPEAGGSKAGSGDSGSPATDSKPGNAVDSPPKPVPPSVKTPQHPPESGGQPQQSPPSARDKQKTTETPKKKAVTVEQFKAAATDFRAYMRKTGWSVRKYQDMAGAIASVLMYGRCDEYERARARGPASLQDLFERTKAERDILHGRCFYLDVSAASSWPVFVHNWSKGRATVTVTVPFEARGGGDGLSTFDFRQCDDPREDTYSSSTFGVLLKNGKLQTTSQYNGRIIGGQRINWKIYGSEAMNLAEQGFVTYAPKQPYTYVRLRRVDISAEQADRYGIGKNGGGLRVRVYFTGLSYKGPTGEHKKLTRKVIYFRLDAARRFGSHHLERSANWGLDGGTAKPPRVFITTLPDPTDYVRADVVAIEVREPGGALLVKKDVGTAACYGLTPDSVAAQKAAVVRGKAEPEPHRLNGKRPVEGNDTHAGDKTPAKSHGSLRAIWTIPGWHKLPVGSSSASSQVWSVKLQVRERNRSSSICAVVFGPKVRSKTDQAWLEFRDAHFKSFNSSLRKVSGLTGTKVSKQTVNGVEYHRGTGFIRGKMIVTVFVGLHDGRCVTYRFAGSTARLSQVMRHLGEAKPLGESPAAGSEPTDSASPRAPMKAGVTDADKSSTRADKTKAPVAPRSTDVRELVIVAVIDGRSDLHVTPTGFSCGTSSTSNLACEMGGRSWSTVGNGIRSGGTRTIPGGVI